MSEEVLTSEEDGILVVDDYGHHPREVAATLAERSIGDERGSEAT